MPFVLLSNKKVVDFGGKIKFENKNYKSDNRVDSDSRGIEAGYLQSQQVGSRPVSAACIMAVAHPAPLLTIIAKVGQLIWQAPHSMQASLLITSALPFFLAKTLQGHTVQHISHPMHKS